LVALLTGLVIPGPWASPPVNAEDDAAPARAARQESRLLSNIRQLTFDGRRAGEGYFSRDGRQMVFQSEREPGNPFFQIYLMDLESGDVQRVSPGHGKTTCAWIHPAGNRVLFASTQHDPQARAKQQEEMRLRESGQERRYSWDYDPHFDLYHHDLVTGQDTNLTRTRGYDAEGSYSPDGEWIAFASNRVAYQEPLPDELREKFVVDPSLLTDIYIMRADGRQVRRLTEALGYDGGPFFSPDGKRICWRRFAENGATAEIMTMNVDGSDKQQLTRLQAMSWAPFYHPSGEYLIFATNLHGFGNFELYLVDSQGRREPARVTWTDGFDGLPAFAPDGRRLAWTSNRTAGGQSQLFVAQWNHAAALRLLGVARDSEVAASAGNADAPEQIARESSRQARADFVPTDIMRHVDYLCRPELGGRLTGTGGEQLATSYVAAYFEQIGLEPAGEDGTWFQPFEFTAGVDLGGGNMLQAGATTFQVGKNWQPLAFSATGPVAESAVVFAGYGITAPESEDQEAYDSYAHLDVQDRWVLIFRFLPEDILPERRQHLARHASLRYKTMVARDNGARGLLVVSGPNSHVREELIPLQSDGTLSGASIPVLSVTNELVQRWMATAGSEAPDLKALQTKLDSGEQVMGMAIDGLTLSANIDIRKVQQTGRNVLGRLSAPASADGTRPAETVIVGAHVDHLGTGGGASSLAQDDEKNRVHRGADDNASGVAALLEVAEYLCDLNRRGSLPLRRDVLFAAWSGEELGLLGSNHFAQSLAESQATHARSASAERAAHGDDHDRITTQSPTASTGTDSHASPGSDTQASHSSTHAGSLYPAVAACLNMDMVGRLEKKLVLQGVGSSSVWRGEIERRNVPVGLPITLQNDSYLPTDASTFFMRGVPILSAFTGSHSEYHTPRDTPDKLNYDGAARIARLMGLLTRSLATRESPPDYIPQTQPAEGQRRAYLRAYLGTIPDYAESDVQGVRLSGVSREGPAAQAGVQAGDVIVELAGRKIENIYDYTYAIEALKIGDPVKIVVQRSDQRVTLEVVPGSRQ
jgi:Tol biopolymer transport system component